MAETSKAGRTESGLVVVDKPAGLTSHDVVARLRRALGTKKVGHAGTLDPMATGVLVVGVNRATRLLGHLTLAEKSYDATIRLGASTTTDDAEGEVVAVTATDGVTEQAVREVAGEFVGDIAQVPAAVSAIKVDGRRAYDRVRAGEEVELAARAVTVHELTVHEVSTSPHLDVVISLRCSSGTYVRAIARDLGARLGVGGHLVALRRTTVGPFGLAEASDLEEPRMLTIAQAARTAFPARDLSEAQATDVRFGRKLDLQLTEITAVFAPDGQFLALYRPDGESARAVAVFAS